MRILVTNDDGIYAEGLWALVDSVRQVGEVIVSAPDREQSAVGTCVTLHNALRMKKVQPLISGIETYAIEGTPADSVILGLQMLARDGIDLLISGINEGVNLGNDVFISGTVGAALQGYFYDIPSIAISAALVDGQVTFEAAAKTALLLARRVKAGVFPPRLLLNVNVPHAPFEEIRGVELTRPGKRTYHDSIEQGNDGKRDYYWIVRGEPVWEEREGTDIWAIRRNIVSIASLPMNFPGSTRSRILADVCSGLYEELCPSAIGEGDRRT